MVDLCVKLHLDKAYSREKYYMHKDIWSESYILMEEENQKLWEKQYGCFRDEAFSLMNKCLFTKGKSDIEKLQEFFGNTEIIKQLSEVNDFAFVLVAMEIYELEKEAGIENHIFYWTDTLSELIDIIRQVKFLLWEIEFLDSHEASGLLLGFLSDVGISMPAFEYIIHISSCDKKRVVGIINQLFG